MKNISIWLEELEYKNKSRLEKNIETDILIIGGGITGISTAYFLKDSNQKVVIVERNKCLHGVTSKTTGKINYLQGIIYTKLEKKYQRKIATAYLKSQKKAITIIENIIKKEKINCDFEKVTSKVTTTNKKNDLKKEYQFLKEQGITISEYETDNIYGIEVEDTYVFHPIKFLAALIQKLENKVQIYENTNITEIKKENHAFIARAENNYKIKAKKIVFACHYPFFLFPYLFPLKTNIEKSYIRATPVLNNEQYTLITVDNEILSERFLKSNNKVYKLTLTKSHNISSKWNEEKNFSPLKRSADSYFWSNEDIMTFDSLPLIGELEKNLYIGTGYNTWGMTNGTLAGKILSDMILKKDSEYQKLFDPHRSSIKNKMIQYPINIFYNTKSFIGSKIKKEKDWYPKNLVFKKVGSETIAIYKDELGTHKVKTICPHLGCSLIFNKIEKTWDCPCHASRFDIDGNCIKGPSKYNIKIK